MKKAVIIGCLILVLGAGILVIVQRGRSRAAPSRPQNAALLLLRPPAAASNSPVQFCLTNGTGARVACIPAALEQRSGEAWVRLPLTGGGSRALRGWVGVPEVLGPGEARNFTVPAPAATGAWRLVFMCQEQTAVADPVIDTARRLTDAKARSNGLQQFSGRRYEVTSPELAP